MTGPPARSEPQASEAGFKSRRRSADPPPVRDGCCPVCNADVPMSGEERAGDVVFCTYCSAPLRFARLSDENEPELAEED